MAYIKMHTIVLASPGTGKFRTNNFAFNKSVDFQLVLSDCALEKQETKQHFWLVLETSELGYKRKEDHVVSTEVNFPGK